MFNYPTLSSLTCLALQAIAAIDERHGNEFSFQEIYGGLERRSLLRDLSNKLPESFDLGLIMADEKQHLGLIHVLTEAAKALRGKESRKAGVGRFGLTLLMAIILEAIQQGNWTTPSLDPLSPKEAASLLAEGRIYLPAVVAETDGISPELHDSGMEATDDGEAPPYVN